MLFPIFFNAAITKISARTKYEWGTPEYHLVCFQYAYFIWIKFWSTVIVWTKYRSTMTKTQLTIPNTRAKQVKTMNIIEFSFDLIITRTTINSITRCIDPIRFGLYYTKNDFHHACSKFIPLFSQENST